MHVVAANACSMPMHKNGAHQKLRAAVCCIIHYNTHLALVNKVEDTHALLLCKLCCSICQLLGQLLHIITAEPHLIAEFELQPCCRIPGSVPASQMNRGSTATSAPGHGEDGLEQLQHSPDVQLHRAMVFAVITRMWNH